MQGVDHRRPAKERTVAPISKPKQSLRWEPRPTPDCSGCVALACAIGRHQRLLVNQATDVTSTVVVVTRLMLMCHNLATSRCFRHALRCPLFKALEDTADGYDHTSNVRYKSIKQSYCMVTVVQ